MKRPLLVIAGLLLSVSTLALQVIGIVAHVEGTASSLSASPLLQAASNGNKKFVVALVKKADPVARRKENGSQKTQVRNQKSGVMKASIANAQPPLLPSEFRPLPSPSPLTAALLPIATFPAVLDQADIHEDDKETLSPILRALQPECLAKLKDLYVVYNGSLTSRGFAGKGTVMLDGTAPEMKQVALHEVLGHFQGLTCLGGTRGSAPSEFKDGNEPIPLDSPLVVFFRLSWTNENTPHDDAAPGNFVSGYALKGGAHEDFAETVALYTSQRSAFEEMAKQDPVIAQKLAWMRTYLPQQTPILNGSYGVEGMKRPWDVTRLTL